MEARFFVLVLLGVHYCAGLPVVKDKVKEKLVPDVDLGEYMRYWEEMAQNDPSLMERLKKVKDMDLSKLAEMIAKNPHLQERIAESRGDFRNQGEEARRITVEQMRQLQKLQSMRSNNLLKDGDWMTKKEALRENLPATFNDQDIRAKLQEAKLKLEALDRKRKDDFKQEEMWQEHRRRQKLKDMNEQQRLKAEEDFRKKHEQLRQHDKLPKPASKEQLEQVWEEEDGMNREEFNPRTFFHMHDTNADLTLDPLELEALFYNELKKVYKEDVDGLEAGEDMARMREYAVEQIDQDKDGLVSLDEFLKFTGQPDFDNKEEWRPIVDEEVPYSDKEFEAYEEDYDEDYDYQYDSEGNIIGIVPRSHPSSPAPAPGNEGQPPQGQPHPSEPPQGQPQQGQPLQGQPPQGQSPPERKGDAEVPIGVLQVPDANAGIHMQAVPVQEDHEQRMAPPPPKQNPDAV